MFGSVSLAAVAVALPGAQALAAQGTPAVEQAIEYLCDDHQQVLTVRGGDPVRTLLSVKGRTDLQDIHLHDVPSANGVKTSNGKWVWWTRGDEGFLAEEDPPAGSGEIVINGCRDIQATP